LAPSRGLNESIGNGVPTSDGSSIDCQCNSHSIVSQNHCSGRSFQFPLKTLALHSPVLILIASSKGGLKELIAFHPTFVSRRKKICAVSGSIMCWSFPLDTDSKCASYSTSERSFNHLSTISIAFEGTVITFYLPEHSPDWNAGPFANTHSFDN